MKTGFIGAGKVGFSLGKLLVSKGIDVTGYYNRHTDAAIKAADFTGSKYFTDIQSLIDCSDILFITVADNAISYVYEQLKELKIKGKIICHCSGAMTASEAFPDIEKYGAFGVSVHPLFPVSDYYNAYEKLSDAFFCLEGGSEKTDSVEKMLADMGLKVRRISSDNKVCYHAACAIASNLYCALVEESVQLLAGCGFDEDEALCALAPLIRANVDSILASGPVKALTGPVERGDYETVRKHMSCLLYADERQLYAGVSRKLVDIASMRHPDRDYKDIIRILNEI